MKKNYFVTYFLLQYETLDISHSVNKPVYAEPITIEVNENANAEEIYTKIQDEIFNQSAFNIGFPQYIKIISIAKL